MRTPPSIDPSSWSPHRPKAMVTKQGGTTYTFVTDGFEAAIEQARATAGERDVLVLGGALPSSSNPLRAGLVSEWHLSPRPHLARCWYALVRWRGRRAHSGSKRTRLIDAEGVSTSPFAS